MIKTFLCAAFLLMFSVNSHALCKTDKILKSKGWVVYQSNFNKHYTEALNWLAEEADQFVNESDSKNTVIRSSVARKYLRVLSNDHLATPSELMMGDLVTLEEAFDKTPVEVRWFDGRRKYVAYDKKQTPCATNLIPFVVNSLY